jgi:hypothetical protein
MRSRNAVVNTILALGAWAAASGCSGRDELIQPPVLSPLAGLSESPARDTTGTTPPPTGTAGPGNLAGTIVGPSPVGSNGDTLAAAPRVSGVEVTVYQVISQAGPLPEVGPPLATTLSGSDGKFAFQGLPGGPIVVTFEPPSSGPYAGTWSSSTIHAGSGDYPWWVVLPTK